MTAGEALADALVRGYLTCKGDPACVHSAAVMEGRLASLLGVPRETIAAMPEDALLQIVRSVPESRLRAEAQAWRNRIRDALAQRRSLMGTGRLEEGEVDILGGIGRAIGEVLSQLGHAAGRGLAGLLEGMGPVLVIGAVLVGAFVLFKDRKP